MSWTNINVLGDIIGTRVFVFDLETTGLVPSNFNKPENKFPNPISNKYNSIDIVEVGWAYFENFNYNHIKQIDIDIHNDIDNFTGTINRLIIKPNNYIITNSSIHGITQEIAEKEGIDFDNAIEFIGPIILSCDYIIGYNVFFDVNILLSKLFKHKYFELFEKINNMINDKKILCAGYLASNHMIPKGWIKKFHYQIPKQVEVYKECFGSLPTNAHSAKFDVLALVKIIHYIYENKYIFVGKETIFNIEENIVEKQTNNFNKNNKLKINNNQIPKEFDKFYNVGKKWSREEISQLRLEIKKDLSIDDICVLHGRNTKGIKMAISKYI